MALLSAFNPHEYTPAQLNALATARETELARALDTIRSNLSAETMQHLIISAPRGYGKSFLMRHIQVEAQRIAEAEKLPLAVVLMPEEMPHVKEPETLIQEITRALTGGGGETAQLRWHEDDGEAWDAAISCLQAAITEKLGKDGLLVALVENFDQLLRRAFRRDVHAQRLRNLITLPGDRLMLIAASASGAIDRDYDKALFQAFEEIALEPWSVDECMSFFDRQREAAGKPPLDEAAHARAKAVANFIGGTPRLATLLGEKLFDEDLLNAADLLRGLVDELTPYYKSRIESLPGRSQFLLDALLRGGEPATQSEIAVRVRSNSQAAIASPFNDLKSERVVIGLKAPDSAEVLYRVADRVFAHYYRRRIIDHGRELCPLEVLVDLLADFYSPREKLEKAIEFLRLGQIAEARVMARLHDKDLGHPTKNRKKVLHEMTQQSIPLRLIPQASIVGKSLLEKISDKLSHDKIDDAHSIVEIGLNTVQEAKDKAVLLIVRSAMERYEGLDGGLIALESAFLMARLANSPRLIYEVNRFKADSLFDELDMKKEAIELHIKELEAMKGSQNHEEINEINLDIASKLYRVNEKEKAKLIIKEILNKSISIGEKFGLMRALGLMAIIDIDDGNLESSLDRYLILCEVARGSENEIFVKNTYFVGSLLATLTVLWIRNLERTFSCFHMLLSNLHTRMTSGQSQIFDDYDYWLYSFTEVAIRVNEDAELLNEWADVFELYFPVRLAPQILRMRMAVNYHRSGRNAQVLARMEPDFASTLKVMFPPIDPPPEASPKAKRSGGRRRKVSP